MANQLNPRHAEAAKLLAREYLRNREPAQAIDVLLALLRGASPDETVFLLLIQAYESRDLPGDVDSARTLVQQGLKRYPRSRVLRSAARRLGADGK